LLFKTREINPDPNKMDPATNGKPAPTKSAMFPEYKYLQQYSIPNNPAIIVSKIKMLILLLENIFVFNYT